MKLLINLLIIIFSLNSFSQVDENVSPPKNKVPEESMIYMRNGKSIARFTNPETVIMNSIGYLRYSDSIFYGIETNSFYSSETNYRMTNLEILLGYRHIWNRSFIPYAMVQFGPASFKNESDTNLPKGEGISTTIDFGADIFKIMGFKNSLGIRNTSSTFSNKEFQSANFLDIYWMIGFVF